MDNAYSIKGNEFVDAVLNMDFDNAEDYEHLLEVLDLVKIKDGYVLDFYKTRQYEYETVPYVREVNAERNGYDMLWFMHSDEKDFLQGFDIPFNEMGIWQGYLLHILIDITPKDGHANYGAVTEIYGDADLYKVMGVSPHHDNDASDYKKLLMGLGYKPEEVREALKPIGSKPKDITEGLLQYIGSEDILPTVSIINDDEAEIISTFWSEFGGLIKETTIATRNGNTINFESKDQVVLVKYNCGICY